MAFRIKSPEELAALAARSPREKAVDEAKERFLRTVKGFAIDQEARRRGSTDLRVITLGDYPSASFGAQVKDWDRKVRTTSSISMTYREDGERVTHANASEMKIAAYWSSRTDREEHRGNNGIDPLIDLSDMDIGTKVTLVGQERAVPRTDGKGDDMVFFATKARVGEHEWNDMMVMERDSLADFVDRYVNVLPVTYRDDVAQMYAEKYVDREEAKAASLVKEAAGSKSIRSADVGSKGPSVETVPAMPTTRSTQGR